MDRRRGGDRAWSDGNSVAVLIDGHAYFARLHRELLGTRAGDWIHFTDWRGDPDERLDGQGTEIARVLADCARRDVHVRGLVWRSHPDEAHFSEQENLHLVKTINAAGGHVLLDERVARAGSHHQKLFVIRHADGPERDVAFVGGIDLCHGRNDDSAHHGDEQAIELDRRFGRRPPWHDLQLEVHGPAVGDLAHSFRERWSDPTPLDHRNPLRALLRRRAGEDRRPTPLPPAPPDPPPCGTQRVQVLRTYPAKRPRFSFAPDGERSIARAYRKAFGQARRSIYIEDQYLWSMEVADALAEALRREPGLRIVAIVPRYPDRDGRLSGPPYRIGQVHALERVRAAGGDRVAVYDIENDQGAPIYVHAKACVVDDTWVIVGSDNLNRRSWTNDSELSCAIVDDHTTFARDLRIRLWREHLGAAGDIELVDFEHGLAAFERVAERLEAFHAGGCRGPRPDGRVRRHVVAPVPRWQRSWATPMYRFLVDPDGRPRAMRRRNEM